MKQTGGVWMPEDEKHMTAWMEKMQQVVNGKLTYQYHKLTATMQHVKKRRTVVDVGAHVGTWSMHFAGMFEHVHAFEPIELHRACFAKNLEGCMNYTLHACALGEKDGTIAMVRYPGNSGNTHADFPGSSDGTPVKRLDDFNLVNVDLIKLDCEGYELFALRGAKETILRDRPAIIVEQKPGRAQKYGLGETEAVDWLKRLGMSLRQVISGDYILTF